MNRMHIITQVAFLAISVLFSGLLSADENPVPMTLPELKIAVEELVNENDLPTVGIALVDESGREVGASSLRETRCCGMSGIR